MWKREEEWERDRARKREREINRAREIEKERVKTIVKNGGILWQNCDTYTLFYHCASQERPRVVSPSAKFSFLSHIHTHIHCLTLSHTFYLPPHPLLRRLKLTSDVCGCVYSAHVCSFPEPAVCTLSFGYHFLYYICYSLCFLARKCLLVFTKRMYMLAVEAT